MLLSRSSIDVRVDGLRLASAAKGDQRRPEVFLSALALKVHRVNDSH